MEQAHFSKIATELNIRQAQAAAVAGLLEEGATIPFIARYRKEVTGSLDEVAITAVRDRLKQLQELAARREAILKSLEERKLLTPELDKKVRAAESLTSLEDVYLPFRPKRKTKASVARERGLEPLALLLLEQLDQTDPLAEAGRFVDPEKEVGGAEEALAGARDIIAELAAEEQVVRERMRGLYGTQAVMVSKVVKGHEEEGANFRDYFDWEEPLAKAPSHRVLAVRRGAQEGHLSLRIRVDEDKALGILERIFIKADNGSSEQVRQALADGHKRLLGPAMEVEFRMDSKKRADAEAIAVFADNLRNLLLAAPLGRKRILAVDPGLRTGCKLAVLDPQGRLLTHDTVYLVKSEGAREAAARTIKSLVEQHQVEAVAVGNGTGGRDTEAFIRGLGLPGRVAVIMVSESGASVYSASESARTEFPDLDVSVRGAVSIGRRLADPLAELVKIDPKSIGVGQYQHDVDQRALKGSLDDVVVSCVNAVGVEVNTASKELLAYVSGLGPSLAANIVAHRDQEGPFASRRDISGVPRLGPKAFEQAAGFLRISGAKNPLDASAVHPESYHVVEAMAADLKTTVAELMAGPKLRAGIDLARYVTDKVGLPTLEDILGELDKPGRDPREKFETVEFAEGVNELEDLRPGMALNGVVTNVVAFGAFVDVGVHQDGLVHISQLADRFVKHPSEVVKVHQKVKVRVLEVDLNRKRISLTMRAEKPSGASGARNDGPKPKNDKRPGPPPAPKPKGAFNDALARALKGKAK